MNKTTMWLQLPVCGHTYGIWLYSPDEALVERFRKLMYPLMISGDQKYRKLVIFHQSNNKDCHFFEFLGGYVDLPEYQEVMLDLLFFVQEKLGLKDDDVQIQ